ncbi:MAG TPA: glycoside hydrolase domain-containing protein [Actinophytocola sp.]|uniref:glycoside hydrolase domain-containing protein n=1 Tax=Actinophytocola sp. TaxID=1872138 RepID=UPI002DBC0DD3|nr:glycoside hydrolase domain-containing protein [Actinophytocola sp.]HEU5475828.1 glycoside hydrolase domain-containing protein [Actinophytocola sp.]
MAQILDYSAGYPGAENVRRMGFAGVIRYLRKEGSSRVRPLTAAEVADMRARGLGIALVYQHVSTSRVSQGRAAGRHDANWALSQARAVGIEPRAIYFAVDYDAGPGTVVEYFRGACDVLGVGRVGGYGGFRVVGHLFDLGLIRWGWQTVAWSAGRREGRAHLFQRLGQISCGGIRCDVNDVLKADYGQTSGPGSDEEDDMPYSEKQLEDVVYRAVHNLLIDAHSEVPGMGAGAANALRGILAGLAGPDPAEFAAVLAGPLAERLIAAGALGITPDQVADALSGVLGQFGIAAQQPEREGSVP